MNDTEGVEERRAGRPFAIDNAPRVDLPDGRGWRTRLVDKAIGATLLDVHINSIRPGDQGGPYHLHGNAENVYFILEGVGVVTIEGEEYDVRQGHVVFFPPGVPHALRNSGSGVLRLVEIHSPADRDFAVLTPEDFPSRDLG